MQAELSSRTRPVRADESYVGCRLASSKLVNEVAFTSRPGAGRALLRTQRSIIGPIRASQDS